MTDIRWDILRPVDVGERFQQGYQGAQRNALMQREQAYQDQERAYQGQQRAQAQQAQVTQQQRENVRLGARIARSIEQLTGRPMDQAGWQQARAAFAQAGGDLAGVPEQFDPNYYQRLIAAGQGLETQQQQQSPNIQREVDYYRSIGRPDLAQQLLLNHAEGSPVVFDVNGDGAPDLVPRRYFNNPGGGGGQTQQPPRPLTDEEIRALDSGQPPAAAASATPDLDNWNNAGRPSRAGSGTFR